MEAAAGYIERELTALGESVERQTYPVGDQQAVNLVVEHQGTRRPEQIVILGAHYDTVPETPGADDNASAVAMLIEVARLLNGVSARRTLRFVAFANEEPPHFYSQTMGSQVYAGQCRQRGEAIVGMLCLEMVGYYTDAPASQQAPPLIPRPLRWLLPRRGNFLAAVSNLPSAGLLWPFRRGFKRISRFRLFAIALPQIVHEIRLSDHGPFWDLGFPAMMLTDTSFFRNPHYHRPTDTPDTLNYASMAHVTVGVAGGVARIAGAAKMPGA